MGIVPPLGVGESLTARRLTASPLADETNPLDSVSIGLPLSVGVSLSHPPIFSVRRAMRPSRRCGPRLPAEHHSTVSAILKPFPPAWRGIPVRCPKSYNLPSDAARAPPVPGFSSPYSSARLSVWQRSLGLMSWRWHWSPGGLLCLPSACDAHPFNALSLDLPSDVARASLLGVPNCFYLLSR